MAKLPLIYVEQRAQPPRPHGMMDHYSSLCINTNMLLNLDGKAEESQPAKVPYFKGAVRSSGVGRGVTVNNLCYNESN